MKAAQLLHSWFLALTLAGAANEALADKIPDPSPRDARIGLADYQSDQVFTIAVAKGVVTRISLGADEVIREVAAGFIADCARADSEWCIKAEAGQNQIWVKPYRKATTNNLEIATTKRDYSLRLMVMSGDENSAGVFYRVVFRHPMTLPLGAALRVDGPTRALVEAPVLPSAATPGPGTASSTGTTASVQTPAPSSGAGAGAADFPTPSVRNYDYSRKVTLGSESLAPAVVFDDGRFTYMRFPKGQEVPAVFAVAADDTEMRLNTHAERLAPDPQRPDSAVERDWLVVHRVARRFVLRMGASVVEVINNRFDAMGVETFNGTTDERLTRVAK